MLPASSFTAFPAQEIYERGANLALARERPLDQPRSPLGTRSIAVGDPGQAFTTIAGRDQASSTYSFEIKSEQIVYCHSQRGERSDLTLAA